MNRYADRNCLALGTEPLLLWAYRDRLAHQAQRGPKELTASKTGPLAAYSSLWKQAAPIEASWHPG